MSNRAQLARCENCGGHITFATQHACPVVRPPRRLHALLLHWRYQIKYVLSADKDAA